MKQNLHLCIHGHFYQPPRENPWTNQNPLEISAAPFHDWNERIFQECYKPNTEAIIVDDKGGILKRVNNYENISFNFGPTLANWIIKNHPKTFYKIIDADKKSVDKHLGHGNAIAQVYNHIIMPLANEQDRITQVKWGLECFEYYFERPAEGIWLAETGCNIATLKTLIKEKIKFIILDPSQALRVREIGNVQWIDVSQNNINPKIPYRCYLDDPDTSADEYIDVFFYDGPIAKSLAFEDIALSPEKFMDRIINAAIPDYEDAQLISIAVDGETFGHHKKFADRSLAYMFSELIPKSEIKIVNYAEYLGMYPPEFEVQIKPGKFEEGTSWSCIHGVGRWKENCGCSIGGASGWDQMWREPLRNALNGLRDKLSVIYEYEAKKYFSNVWNARDKYIDKILDSSNNHIFEEYSIKRLDEKEIKNCTELLEMQKYSMFMFTSCGWFFDDISGLESTKILEYAAMAIELGEKISGINLEFDFLEILNKAKCNLPSLGTGKDIYLKAKNERGNANTVGTD